MNDLGALRSAKQALDEGLITPQDFDVVKVAFLKAQQIKAGLDAGFIRSEDYEKAVDAYMHALDFQVMATLPSLSSGGRPAAAAAPAAAPAATYVHHQQPNPMAAAFGGSRGTSLAGAGAGAGAVGSMGATVQLLPQGRSSGSGAHGFDGMASGPLSNQTSVSEDGGMLDIPADLPDYCKGATAGKKSMSGIAIDESCVNLFMHMKTRKQYKWLIFKVDDSGRTVVPDKIGGQASTYNDFVCSLPDNQCRYAVYDYEYRSPERGVSKKMVFLLWAPDNSGVKPKMMYASTKDFFKGFLDGIGAELQANEPSEISEDEIRERVVSNMTRK
ncbi:actin-depolymerizing factor AdfA [Scenedesmus sp. NREL 46B-D3]|nr:actin-depolymerizing factor AdfA [Scenedesmus sp. NREL 46B-D3]